MGVITKVTEPSEWVNSIVLVPKANGKLRICMDPKDLNQVIMRQHYPLPTVEDIMTRLTGAQIFSILDASTGFWQIQLDEASASLCVFNTPYGRYRFERLPFGLNIGSEAFHQRAVQIFDGLEGVETYIDDVLVWGTTQEEHDQRLRKVLERCEQEKLKLNREKCKVSIHEIKYLGHMITNKGLCIDNDKIKAITDMPKPQDVKELERFLGMVTYVAKFLPNLSDITAPLRELCKKDIAWHWDGPQETTYQKVITLITSAPVLQFFDPSKPVTLSADASKDGLGAVILQDGPIEYASRALTQSEQNYAQIEKELLAMVFACERFHQYVYGREVRVETDHKPLEAIFKKPLVKAPPRILRLMLRMQPYQVCVFYKPGKEMHVADALSRAFLTGSSSDLKKLSDQEKDLNVHVHSLISSLPISQEKLAQLREETLKDPEMKTLASYILAGWPAERRDVATEMRCYWDVKDELTMAETIIFKNDRIVIPGSMRKDMLARLHKSHQGVVSTKKRARDVIYWPGMSKQIEDMISKCSTCLQYRPANQKEPLNSHDIPEQPWAKVGSDLFKFGDRDYLLLVDYYSKFVEIALLENTKSSNVIHHMKSIFARHGIPEELVSDNGPQYSCNEFKQFTQDWHIKHTTSSPKYPQSNGLAERFVGIVKQILKKARKDGQDPYLGLLDYRNTPLAPDIGSPSQLLMGRRLNGTLPTARRLLQPATVDCKSVIPKLKSKQSIEKARYDKHAKPLPTLKPQDTVRIRVDGEWKPGVVQAKTPEPRSYVVKTNKGTYRRNRRHLMKTQEKPPVFASHVPDNVDIVTPPRRRDAPQVSSDIPKSPTRSSSPSKIPRPQSPLIRSSQW
jgi:hypothetical protein